MIRRDITESIKRAAEGFPAITIIGPRQSRKNTLSGGLFENHAFVSLEAPDHRAFALEDPRGFLAQFSNGAIIGEVQRMPEILSYLQGIVDDNRNPGQWILTGSQNFPLLS
ncbi:MAG: AAA family ATPase [Bacteroidota bacterium]|nr:AAA family ATPase [Bacteroidota bacterium]